MKKIYFTIAGTKHHYGHEYFEPKMEVKLIKEPDNLNIRLPFQLIQCYQIL